MAQVRHALSKPRILAPAWGDTDHVERRHRIWRVITELETNVYLLIVLKQQTNTCLNEIFKIYFIFFLTLYSSF